MGHKHAGATAATQGFRHGGHVYMQTNETRNAIVHYLRSADGIITEVERVPTGGAGSGTFKPISGQESAPNAFEGAGSVLLTPDRRFLFTTNGGDNTVTSFSVGSDGRLTVVDRTSTGNPVTGRSGTAKSLAYVPSIGTLVVLHSFGPDHVRLMSVDGAGKLSLRLDRYTVNTPDKPNRVATMATLSPDQRFLFVGTTFDQPPTANPDGSAILWVPGPDGKPKSIASNEPDPDGLIVFPVLPDATLGQPSLYDANGGSPFFIAFLHNQPDTFVIGYAVGDGIAKGTIDDNGRVSIGRPVQIDTSAGKPSELCWLSISPDDRWAFATNFGYSGISSFRIDGPEPVVARDPACPRVPGDGTFRALNGTVSSGPSCSWLTPDGAYLYQIYGNASKLMGYTVQPDGSLEELTSMPIPHNSPQGLAGV
ncbi:beta-propeller fold lactonase family protein [Micromonospora avicenniae]|uniref:Lactonase, 7-bladed beta-propeller n=1 Tax=Micromonospora avicenniae TaxID=1198245 RepID=A0A1N7BMA4_9ACTN|nr:beta-propeller fold lactonase family protein [Micromonospora avicenniae]SIR52455.1 Lactonase, 7-bladed beta-propeller [Micromonospora avicenniae]